MGVGESDCCGHLPFSDVVTTLYKGKGEPLEITDRRPITLLNVDYKLLSKFVP
jgi:hypothetical protein